MPKLVVFPELLKSTRVMSTPTEGMSVSQALSVVPELEGKDRGQLFAILNDLRLPSGSFDTTVLAEDDFLVVKVVPTGNMNHSGTSREGISDWFNIIAGSALVAVGAGVGFFGGPLSWLGAPLAGLGVSMFTSAWADTTTGGAGKTENKKSVSGASNTAELDALVPIVFGKHLLTPNYWCPPHTSISGTDGSEQYVHMLFALGYSDASLAAGAMKVSSLKFGDSLIATNTADVRHGVVSTADGTIGNVEATLYQGSGSDIADFEALGLRYAVKEQAIGTTLDRYRVEHGYSSSIVDRTRTISTTGAVFAENYGDEGGVNYAIGFYVVKAGAGAWEGYKAGDTVHMDGFTNPAYNGDFVVAWTSSNALVTTTPTLTQYNQETVTASFYEEVNIVGSLTFSISSVTRKLTRNEGSFLSDDDDKKISPIAVGDFVTLHGFTTPGNNNTFPVTAVTALELTLGDASTIVTEAASALVWYASSSTSVIDTPKQTTGITVGIEFPSGLVAWDDGDRINCSVIVRWYYRLKTVTAWTAGTYFADSSSGVFTKNVPRTARYEATVSGLVSGQYEVRVVRETFDAPNGDRTDGVIWRTLRCTSGKDSIKLPSTQLGSVCFLGIKVLAGDNMSGRIEKVNCILEKVYKTWDGAGTAEADWAIPATGNEAYCRNPAAAYLHALTGPINPRPMVAPDSTNNIDWEALSELYAYCDTKGFHFDRVYTNGIALRDMLSEILASCRSSFSLKDGKYSLVTDKERTSIVQHISPRNSWNFSGTKSFEPIPHAYKISFINADENWIEDEMVVLDDGYKWDLDGDGVLRDYEGTDRTAASSYILASEFESLTVKNLGITDPQLVTAFGRYLIACRRLRPEVFQVNQDFEALVCTRGDLVRVSHDVPLWGLAQGRIKEVLPSSGDITSIVVDELVQYTTGDSYQIRVRTVTDSITATVVNPGTSLSNTITLSTPLAAGTLEAGQLFFFGKVGLESTECIVIAQEIDSDLSCRLTLVEYNADVYSAEDGIAAFSSRITRNAPLVPGTTVRAISNTRRQEISQQVSGAQAVNLALIQGANAVGSSSTYASALSTALHMQVDKKISTFSDSTPYSDPSVAWTTDDLKRSHHLDMWNKIADTTAPYGSTTYGTWWQWVWTEATLTGAWAQTTDGMELISLQQAAIAQEAADDAQADATSAVNDLLDIADDDKFNPVEKKERRLEWNTFAAEKSDADAQADNYSVSRTAYDAAYVALGTYLNNGVAWSSGVPLWISDVELGNTTDIVGATFRATWQAYYDAYAALLKAISDRAKDITTTIWDSLTVANTTGNGVIGDQFIDVTYTTPLLYRCTVAAPSITIANSVRLTTRIYADVTDTTARNALTGMIYGDTVYQTDTHQWYRYTTAWIEDGLPVLSTSDVDARATALLPRFRGSAASDPGTDNREGDTYYNTATFSLRGYTGGSWSAVISSARFRGSGTSDPASDNREGDTYYNTDWNKLRIYQSAAWVDATNDAILTQDEVDSRVTTVAPRYLGRYDHAHPASYNPGDWWTVYDTDDSPIQRGVWYSNAGTPARITTASATTLQAKFVEAIPDVAWAEGNVSPDYGTSVDYGISAVFSSIAAVSAFFTELFAQNITATGTITGATLKATDGRIKISSDIDSELKGVQVSSGDVDAPVTDQTLCVTSVGGSGIVGPRWYKRTATPAWTDIAQTGAYRDPTYDQYTIVVGQGSPYATLTVRKGLTSGKRILAFSGASFFTEGILAYDYLHTNSTTRGAVYTKLSAILADGDAMILNGWVDTTTANGPTSRAVRSGTTITIYFGSVAGTVASIACASGEADTIRISVAW